MAFVKRGDGKIVSVFNKDELTEEQKEAMKKVSEEKEEEEKAKKRD